MTETNKVPAIYESIANVLKHMQVNKDGVLPGNLGGGAYFKASDLFDETKRQFVENDIIILPMEHETSKQVHQQVNGNTTKNIITITIEGTYTLVSTKDGSSVVIGGTGDGIAMGTAVAANVGSTNALKNALLRFLLVTEQAVERASMEGIPDTQTPVERNVAKAAQASAPKAPAARPAVTASAPAAKDVIREQYIDTGKLDKAKANSLMNTVKGDNPNLAGEELWAEILVRVKAELGES